MEREPLARIAGRTWRPQFSLHSLLLVVMVAAVGLGLYRHWSIGQTPIDWQAFGFREIRLELARGNRVLLIVNSRYFIHHAAYRDKVFERPRMRHFFYYQHIIPLEIDTSSPKFCSQSELEWLGIEKGWSVVLYRPGRTRPVVIRAMLTEQEMRTAIQAALAEPTMGSDWESPTGGIQSQETRQSARGSVYLLAKSRVSVLGGVALGGRG